MKINQSNESGDAIDEQEFTRRLKHSAAHAVGLLNHIVQNIETEGRSSGRLPSIGEVSGLQLFASWREPSLTSCRE